MTERWAYEGCKSTVLSYVEYRGAAVTQRTRRENYAENWCTKEKTESEPKVNVAWEFILKRHLMWMLQVETEKW